MEVQFHKQSFLWNDQAKLPNQMNISIIFMSDFFYNFKIITYCLFINDFTSYFKSNTSIYIYFYNQIHSKI